MKEAPSNPIMKAGSKVSSKTESPVRLTKSATRSETSLCGTGVRVHLSRTMKAPDAKTTIAAAAAHPALAAHGLLFWARMRVPARGPNHTSRSARISVALAYRFSLSISRQRTAIAFKGFGVSGTSSIGGGTFSQVRLYNEAIDVSAL